MLRLRIVRDYGIGAGALLLVLAFILSTFGPEGRAVTLGVGGFGAALLAAGLASDRRRVAAFLSGRRGRAAGASIGYTLTVIAVVILLNFLAGRHHWRKDLTEDQSFSLSEQTVRVLEELPRPVTVSAFYQDSEPTRQRLKDLLDEYGYRTDLLTVRFFDPDKKPAEVRRYGVEEYGTIVLESGERESRITSADEESLTNALIDVTRDVERIVYFTTGHGERGLDDAGRGGITLLKEALEKQHYTLKPLVLNRGVPEDATLLVVAGVEKRFLDAEVAMIAEYLERDGRLFLLQDPGRDPGLGEVLARFGVAVRDDVIIDKISQLFGGDALVPMVPGDAYDGTHPITRNFDYQTFYPMASSIAVDQELPEQVSVAKLARTSDYSWGEMSAEERRGGTITMNEGVDVAGPLTIGAAIVRSAPPGGAGEDDGPDEADGGEVDDLTGEGGNASGDEATAGGTETRLLLFGDSDVLSNAYFNASGNADLMLNGIAWLAEQGELVSIRPRAHTPRIVVLTTQQVFFYFWTIVALGPLAITVAGVGVWLRRRKL